MTGKHGVNDNGRADQRQRHKGEANLRAGEILRRYRTELRADGSAGMHHQGNQYVYVAFDRVGKGAVAGGNDDLKKISADSEMGGNSQDINHRRHPDVTGAAAKKSAAQSADERDQQNNPE